MQETLWNLITNYCVKNLTWTETKDSIVETKIKVLKVQEIDVQHTKKDMEFQPLLWWALGESENVSICTKQPLNFKAII